jgi:hypothetical protein
MARSISTNNATALAARQLVARDFLWIVARDRGTGAAVPDGMWSDVGTISSPVLNPDTGTTDTRTFYGAGALISVSDISAVANLTVQNVTITLSQVDAHVATLIRTYDVKQCRIELYRGLFDPSTKLLVDPAQCRFVGFIDNVVVKTPSENNVGSVTLSCVSHTQEMTRSNPDTRSNESQKLRSSTDTFFIDTPTVGSWVHFWGETSATVTTAPSQAKQGLLGWGNFLGFL